MRHSDSVPGAAQSAVREGTPAAVLVLPGPRPCGLLPASTRSGSGWGSGSITEVGVSAAPGGADAVVRKSNRLRGEPVPAAQTLGLRAQTPRCRSLPTVTTSHGRVSALDPEQGHCPADAARNPRCGDRPGVHTVTQPAGPLPLSPPAPLSEASFSPRIRFSSSGTGPHTLPYAGNLGGCKERDGSNLDFSVWLLSLRLFSVSTHAVTCISPSFVFSLRSAQSRLHSQCRRYQTSSGVFTDTEATTPKRVWTRGGPRRAEARGARAQRQRPLPDRTPPEEPQEPNPCGA